MTGVVGQHRGSPLSAEAVLGIETAADGVSRRAYGSSGLHTLRATVQPEGRVRPEFRPYVYGLSDAVLRPGFQKREAVKGG